MQPARVVTVIVALSMLSAAAGARSADTGCSGFRYREDAQKVYDADSDIPHGRDPYGLDEDGDGLACEELPLRGREAPADERAPVASGQDESADGVSKTFTLRLDGEVPEGVVFYVEYTPVRVNGQTDFLVFCGEGKGATYVDPAARPCRGGGAVYAQTLETLTGARIEFSYVRATSVVTGVLERFQAGTETLDADSTTSASYAFGGAGAGALTSGPSGGDLMAAAWRAGLRLR